MDNYSSKITYNNIHDKNVQNMVMHKYLQSISCATDEEYFLVPKLIALIRPLAAFTARGITTSCDNDTNDGCICPLVIEPFLSRLSLVESLQSSRGEGLGTKSSLGVDGTIPFDWILPVDPLASSIALRMIIEIKM